MNAQTKFELWLVTLMACWHWSGEAAPGIEILRDRWGVAHVFSDTDAGAFKGLGYATAEDRAFQMTYSLRIIQGRLAEVIGDVKQGNRKDTSVDHDRLMRTFGFYRAAQRLAANLDPDAKDLLQAYCDGVNEYFTRHSNDLHPLFARLAVKPEPWTPADCLVSWWHLAQFFAGDGTRELIARRNRANQPQGRAAAQRGQQQRAIPTPSPDLKPMPQDDGPAVVKRADVSKAWIQQVFAFSRAHGMSGATNGVEGPKFSHAWVVGGTKTTTGSSVLVSDPQTPVRNPPLFYEYHLQGKTFNARGIGVPGSPVILIGFTENVAWGMTALGADQADLFMLETDAAHPDQYKFDGQWLNMKVLREQILVKGGAPLDFQIRETHLGPVATAFCFAQPDEGEVALRRVPICDTNKETITASIAMMRARNARDFDAALGDWRFPSANAVFGDKAGAIGYRAIAAIPVRSRGDRNAGLYAAAGHGKADDWQDFVPASLMPHVLNPSAGYLYSGNHRAVESWYPIPLGTSTGAGGDTLRSWRLRERLEAQSKFTPEDVKAIHNDSVNPARRDIVRIGLHLRDKQKHVFSGEARLALEILEPWYKAGASTALTQPGAELAVELNTFFRFLATQLAFVYGGGESGLAYFLKSAAARLDKDPQTKFTNLEAEFIDQSLATAWENAEESYGEDPGQWNARARRAMTQRRLGYYESLDGFPSLDPTRDLNMPALSNPDGGTIACQPAQSYTQWVPMHDPDQAQTILPIGQSERPDAVSRTSTMQLWGKGELHPAPLSRERVEKLAVLRLRL